MGGLPRTYFFRLLFAARSRVADRPGLVVESRKSWRKIGVGVLVVGLAGALIGVWVVQEASRASRQPAPQTAVARRGNIVLSASGTGTLQPAKERGLSFKTSGTLAILNVKAGDAVTQGQLLAELDNSSEELAYAQAQQKLDGLTSISAIGVAQQALAKAEQNLQSAELQLEYLISPEVYYWENEIAKDQETVRTTGASAAAAPADNAAQARLKRAQAILDFANDKLRSAQDTYKHDYVPATFTITRFNHLTNRLETRVEAPSADEILKARQDITIANGGVNDAGTLYSVLTGGEIPADASGSGLTALLQARSDLLSAKENLVATRIVAPFNGTVTAVNAQVGTTVGTSSILTVADLTRLYVRTYVDESDLSLFRVGNEARVVFDARPDQTLVGHVFEVDPVLDTSSGSSAVSGLVELDPTALDLLLGMGGSVEIIGGQAQNVVMIPLAALHRDASDSYSVLVVRGGKPVAQSVEVGLQDLVNAEIKGGLQVGDIVMMSTEGSTP